MTKSKFGNPCLADGRDLLLHVLPDGHKEWLPSLSIQQVITQIPKFVKEYLNQKPSQAAQMTGRFHPGLNYDMDVWKSN